MARWDGTIADIDFRYVSPTVNNVGGSGNWQALSVCWARALSRPVAGQAGVRANVDTGPDQPRPERELFRSQSTERQQLLSPAPWYFSISTIPSCCLCQTFRWRDQARSTRDCRASAWRTPCRSSTSGYRSPSAHAARRVATGSTSTHLVSATDDDHDLRRIDLEPGLCRRGEAAGKRFVVRQLHRGTSARKRRRHGLRQCRRKCFLRTVPTQKEAGVKVDFGRMIRRPWQPSRSRSRPLSRLVSRRMRRQTADGEQRQSRRRDQRVRRTHADDPPPGRRGVHRWTADEDHRTAPMTDTRPRASPT